jgi:hypothetical protein
MDQVNLELLIRQEKRGLSSPENKKLPKSVS